MLLDSDPRTGPADISGIVKIVPALPTGVTASTPNGNLQLDGATTITSAFRGPVLYYFEVTFNGGTEPLVLSIDVQKREARPRLLVAAVLTAVAALVFEYTAASYSFTLGVSVPTSGTACACIASGIAGGDTLTWTSQPPLPGGLTLNADGSISGAPNEALALTSYRITGTHTSSPGNPYSVDIRIEVIAPGEPTVTSLDSKLSRVDQETQEALETGASGYAVCRCA